MTIFLCILAAYLSLGETIPDGPFAYEGKYPREILTVDPKNTPLLDAAYKTLKERIRKSDEEEKILETVLLLVRDELFERERSQEVFSNITAEEEIPLETFLENKIGICRHFALTTTLLIDRLIKEEILIGEVKLIREETPFGRHGWTLFTSGSGRWHIDPYLDSMENAKNSIGLLRLCQKYGKQTMKRYEEEK